MKALILGGGAIAPESDAISVWLAENGGRLLVERFVAGCAALGAGMVFAVREAELKRLRIDSVIELAAPGSALVRVSGETAGAACTALLCIGHIDPDAELLILNSNEYLDIDYAAPVAAFRARGLDAGVVTFPSIHPRYSYVRLNEAGWVVEATEKNPISRHATPGFTWFAKGADFIAAAQSMIRKDAQVDGRFYISLTLNELVLRQKRIGAFEIEARRYHPLKSQRQLAAYESEDMDAE
jgi:hypothetical protein